MSLLESVRGSGVEPGSPSAVTISLVERTLCPVLQADFGLVIDCLVKRIVLRSGSQKSRKLACAQ